MRTSCSHRKDLRGANVRLAADRPVNGIEQEKRRSTGSQSRGKSAFSVSVIVRPGIDRYNST